MDAQLIANNPQEEVLLKIRAMRKENIIPSQPAKIKQLEEGIYELFLKLVKSLYELEREQLIQFSDDQIEALAKNVYLRVKTRAIIGGIFLWTFGILLPVIDGLIFSEDDWDRDGFSPAYSYIKRCRQLRNIVGDKYFSAKRLRELNP